VVRQLADVVGGDGVHHLELSAFHGDGGALRLALAGHDDLIDLGGRVVLNLGLGAGRKSGADQGGGGEQKPLPAL